MKKLNRKGFTLVELLAVIVVIAVVLALSAYGIINAYKASRDKALVLNQKSVIEAARIFAGEDIVKDRVWFTDEKDESQTHEFFCTTIQELKNYGLLNKDTDAGGLDPRSFIYIGRDKNTRTIDTAEITTDGDRSSQCNMHYRVYQFEYHICDNKNDESSCVFDHSVSSGLIPETAGEYIYSLDKLPVDDTGEYRYEGWYSSLGSTNVIQEYVEDEIVTGDDNPIIKFYAIKSKIHSVYVYYLVNTGKQKPDSVKYDFWSLVDNGPNNEQIARYSFLKRGSEFKSKTIKYGEKIGTYGLADYHNASAGVDPRYIYIVNGLDQNRLANSKSEWKCVGECNAESKQYDQAKEDYTSDDFCDASESDCNVYLEVNWAELTTGNVNIRFAKDTDTEFSPASNNSYSWSTRGPSIAYNGLNYDIITRNGEDLIQTIEPGKSIGNVNRYGLYDYNNGTNLNLTKDGYVGPSSSEAWKCISGCTTSGKIFSQTDTSYVQTDFCNPPYGGDCDVVLAPNWQSEDDPSISVKLTCVKDSGTTVIGDSYYNTLNTSGTDVNSSAVNPSSKNWINKSTCDGLLELEYTFKGNNLQTGNTNIYYNTSGSSTFNVSNLNKGNDFVPVNNGTRYFDFSEGIRYLKLTVCNKSNRCVTNQTALKYDKTAPAVSFNESSISSFSYDPIDVDSDLTWINKSMASSSVNPKWKVTERISGINYVHAYHNSSNQTSADTTKDSMSTYNNLTNSASTGTNLVFTDGFTGEGVRGSYLKACDQAGNCTNTKGNIDVYFKWDKTAPTIDSFNGKIGSTNYAGESNYFKTSDDSNLVWFNSSPVLSWTTSDSFSGINKNAYYQTNARSQKDANSEIAWKGNLTGNSSNKFTTSSEFGQGYRYVKFTVSDKAGNTATRDTWFRLDTDKPSIPNTLLYKWTESEINSYKNNSSYRVTSVGSGRDTYTANSWFNRAVISAPSTSTDNLSGIKEYKYTVPTGSASSSGSNIVAEYRNIIAEGISQIQWKACDKAGNCSDYSSLSTVKLDRTPPTVTFVGKYEAGSTTKLTGAPYVVDNINEISSLSWSDKQPTLKWKIEDDRSGIKTKSANHNASVDDCGESGVNSTFTQSSLTNCNSSTNICEDGFASWGKGIRASYISAVDKAGNESIPVAYYLKYGSCNKLETIYCYVQSDAGSFTEDPYGTLGGKMYSCELKNGADTCDIYLPHTYHNIGWEAQITNAYWHGGYCGATTAISVFSGIGKNVDSCPPPQSGTCTKFTLSKTAEQNCTSGNSNPIVVNGKIIGYTRCKVYATFEEK